MKLIANRGNISGRNREKENSLEYVSNCLKRGYDAKVEVETIRNELYLLSRKKEKINKMFLRDSRIWVECLDINSFLELSKYSDINCFLKTEEISVTSRGFLWSFIKKKWNNKTIVMSEDILSQSKNKPYGICSDYISKYERYRERSLFKVLITDVDGILSNGHKTYDCSGQVISKSFCDLDFSAIKRFFAAGIQVCFLSGDKNINLKMAQAKNIPFFFGPSATDKAEVLPQIKKKYKVSESEIAYVGDDYYDASMMFLVGTSFCPISSPEFIKSICTHIVPVSAGNGVLAGIYDLLKDSLPQTYPSPIS